MGKNVILIFSVCLNIFMLYSHRKNIPLKRSLDAGEASMASLPDTQKPVMEMKEIRSVEDIVQSKDIEKLVTDLVSRVKQCEQGTILRKSDFTEEEREIAEQLKDKNMSEPFQSFMLGVRVNEKLLGRLIENEATTFDDIQSALASLDTSRFESKKTDVLYLASMLPGRKNEARILAYNEVKKNISDLRPNENNIIDGEGRYALSAYDIYLNMNNKSAPVEVINQSLNLFAETRAPHIKKALYEKLIQKFPQEKEMLEAEFQHRGLGVVQ